MSQGAPHPRMHGLTHVPGGTDPIPGLVFDTPAGAYDTAVLAIPDLQAYYRLGEAGPWPENAQDSSTFARHLTATEAITYTNDPTYGHTGAVDPDDGSVRFNQGYYIWTGPFGTKSGLIGGSGTDFGEWSTTTGFTLSAWVKFIQSAAPDSWSPAASDGSDTFPQPMISTYYRDFGGSPINHGWSLRIQPFYGTLQYQTAGASFDFPDALIEDTWYHVCVTLEVLGGGSFRRRMFLNAVEVLDTSTSTGAQSAGGATLSLGGGWIDDVRFDNVQCGLDEIAIWSRPLTDSERGNLHVGSAATASAGEVHTSDGAGGTSWQLVDPTSIVPGPEGYVLTVVSGVPTWVAP